MDKGVREYSLKEKYCMLVFFEGQKNQQWSKLSRLMDGILLIPDFEAVDRESDREVKPIQCFFKRFLAYWENKIVKKKYWLTSFSVFI